MKIALITDETDTQLLGLGTYTLNVTQEILKSDKKNSYTLVHRRKEAHSIYKMAPELVIPAKRFPLSLGRNYVTLPRRLKKEKFDIVHHFSNIGPFVFKSDMPGRKNVQALYDIIPLLRPETFKLPVRLAFKYILPRVMRNADHIISISESSKRDAAKYFKINPEKISVAYPGVHERYKKLYPKKAADAVRKHGLGDYILYTGTLEAKKNLPTLLQAYAALRNKGIEHQLVLVGKRGYGYEAIKETIVKLSLQEHVRELGYIPDDDLPSLYNAASVFVFPSIYEGFGIPVAEAMKCGCPVVTSNGGSLPEVAGSCGKIVDVHDVAGYANAMSEILNNKRVRSEMIRKGLKQVKKFTWKRSAKKTIEVYEKLGT